MRPRIKLKNPISQFQGAAPMRKGHNVTGLTVIGQSDGSDLGKVRDVIFDYESSEVLALLVSEKELFGLIDAQVVPWREILEIGPDSVIVGSRESVIRGGDDARIHDEMNRQHGLVGKNIHTTDGRNLGAFADIYFEDDARIVGYEVTGGLFADAVSGRRFMPVPDSFVIGDDVALVPPAVADHMEAQKSEEPGGLKGAAATVSEKAGGAFAATKDTVASTYADLAGASIEKQKAFVVGKVASRDVTIKAPTAAQQVEAGAPLEGTRVSELGTPTLSGADLSSTGTFIDEQVLVRQGETITAQHADQAEQAGVLHSLVLAAAGSTASDAVQTGREHLGAAGDAAGEYGADAQARAEAAAIGKPAARDVTAPNGSLVVASGMMVTREIIENARLHGKEKEVVASAGMGAASEKVSGGVETVKEGATNLWGTIKERAAELTGAAHERKAEYDASAEQSKINNALGRPVTRVILDQSDSVILNTGDLITNKAINHARETGVLEVLLDSVYTVDPEITPEMLRVQEPGQDALPTQAQPTGGPITATVSPDQPSQSTPAQGQTG